MATKVIEEMRFCSRCQKETLHRKNSKQMSWLMHLFLTVITAGIWLIIWAILLIWHAINKTATAVTNSWVCSECSPREIINNDTPLKPRKVIDSSNVSKQKVLQKVKYDGYALEGLGEYKNDEDIVLEAIKHSLNCFQYAGQKLKSDKAFVLKVIKLYPGSDSWAKIVSSKLLDDEEVLGLALKGNGSVLKYASARLRRNKNLVRIATENGTAFEFADSSLKKDREFILSLLNKAFTGSSVFGAINQDLKKDRLFVVSAIEKIKYKNMVIDQINCELLKDKEIVKKSVQKCGQALKYADDSLKKDKHFVISLFDNTTFYYAHFLPHVDSSLKKDKSVVLAASKANYMNFKDADVSLKRDKRYILDIIKDGVSKDILQYVDSSLDITSAST